MSTPIKPPGSPPTTGSPPSSAESPGAGRVEGRPGELDKMIEGAKEADMDGANALESAPSSRIEQLKAELAAGRIGVDEAIERIVQHALAGAGRLPEANRAALEAQIRAALADDPTLAALRKDLERAAPA
jgi:hypothetical protein